MSKTTTRFIYFLAPLVFIGSEIIRTFVRPEYGKAKYGLLAETLGWLPNLLAGFAIMALAVSGLQLYQDAVSKTVSRNHRILLLLASSAIALTGLILHEIFQKGTGLYYDVNDIVATVAGVLIGAFYFFLVHLRFSES
ncbi:hypothetical protein [Flavobacterium sp.]|uniref:hypothetical protein n=1 Tax=Flavobacterium sp. TaxID=239 RepID=UPI00122AC6E5|nr:hypothetical protein [Flavobacterium sp.]RZJ72281.1 MAG: hypothetical protein EOO49_07465 [Flavobacterium sp.]